MIVVAGAVYPGYVLIYLGDYFFGVVYLRGRISRRADIAVSVLIGRRHGNYGHVRIDEGKIVLETAQMEGHVRNYAVGRSGSFIAAVEEGVVSEFIFGDILVVKTDVAGYKISEKGYVLKPSGLNVADNGFQNLIGKGKAADGYFVAAFYLGFHGVLGGHQL